MKCYKPKNHGENRMKDEGNVVSARKYYFENKSNNLKFLLKKRFTWMNDFINEHDTGIEVGCGTGISKEFIKSSHFKITDYANHEWLDIKMVDALNTPFEKESFDFIVSSNMIHHVPYPMRFFEEMYRILKPKGKIIIQEINCSWVMRKVLRLMRHEGYDFAAKVFDENFICTDPNDLWSANCAIPNLLFDDKVQFANQIKKFRIMHYSFSECLIFLNSGGVISKTIFIPLPKIILKIINGIDSALCKIAPKIFALQRQIVLEKV